MFEAVDDKGAGVLGPDSGNIHRGEEGAEWQGSGVEQEVGGQLCFIAER